MSVDSRYAKVKNILNDHKDIFEDPSVFDYSLKKIGDNIFFPDTTKTTDFYSVPNGVKLKDGIGFISFIENILPGNNIHYLYRFCSDEYTYLFADNGNKECHTDYFNFHYEKNERHPVHVSFLHHSIRYMATDLDLKIFLEHIRETFFDLGGNRKKSFPWHNSF